MKSRLIYIELLRILAVFLVVFIHTRSDGFFLFAQYPPASLQYWLYLFVSISVQVAVPIFLAVSGAVLLHRPSEPLRVLWRSRIMKMLAILIVFSLAYHIEEIICYGGTFSMLGFLGRVYSSTAKYHLWFLYLYIGFLIALPILRTLAQRLTPQFFYYIFALDLILNGLLPMAEFILYPESAPLNSNIKVFLLRSPVILYPLLGYFLRHRIRYESLRRIVPRLWVACLLSILISCYMTHYRGIVMGSLSEESSQMFHNSFGLLKCAAVFATMRLLFERKRLSQTTTGIIHSLGRCTFGIYLLHAFFMGQYLFIPMHRHLNSALGLHPLLSTTLTCLTIFLLSYLITLILSQIPLLKKIVGF